MASGARPPVLAGPGVASTALARLLTGPAPTARAWNVQAIPAPNTRVISTAAVEGTGLGLTLAQRLMTAMARGLGLGSTGPEGSTFWLDLPRTAPPALPPALAIQLPPAPALIAGPLRTLLLIDDNPANLQLVARMLELRPGITILVAQQGGQGLELAQAHRPDLILLDLQLPDLSGEQVLQRLLDDPATARIPVVIFSADATPGQQTRLRAAGATDYLTKPCRVAAFLAMIDQRL